MTQIHKTLIFYFLLLVPVISCAQDLKSLNENSPFVPSNFNPGSRAKQKNTSANSNKKQVFEFQGVYQIGEDWMFSILNKATRQSEWVGLNDSSSSYNVTRFDSETNTISFQFEHQNRELTLRNRSNTTLPVILAKKIVRKVPVRRKVHPNLPKRPPTTAPTYLPPTPPPNYTPPALPASISERRALARRTAIPSTTQGRNVNNSLFTAPTSGQPAIGGLPGGIPSAPPGAPPSLLPPGPPPGKRPPRKN